MIFHCPFNQSRFLKKRKMILSLRCSDFQVSFLPVCLSSPYANAVQYLISFFPATFSHKSFSRQWLHKYPPCILSRLVLKSYSFDTSSCLGQHAKFFLLRTLTSRSRRSPVIRWVPKVFFWSVVKWRPVFKTFSSVIVICMGFNTVAKEWWNAKQSVHSFPFHCHYSWALEHHHQDENIVSFNLNAACHDWFCWLKGNIQSRLLYLHTALPAIA